MKRYSRIISIAVIALFCAVAASSYVIDNWWPDGTDIVMDDVFLPAATFSDPAQFQMSEWNEVDVTDNSHPFRINNSPQFSFGANDGDNTIGFLGEAGLNSQYGLSYASALAWTVCFISGGRYDECDVMLDPTLAWSLAPNDSTWFQSTVLHELGHVRGLDHYNNYLSMQNSGTSKYLRNEILYMDDKVGVRQHASHVSERDLVMYNKWHDGSLPRWMTMSPTTLREGDTIQLHDITVENRGTLAFASTVRFGIYLSTNSFISTGDQLLNTGTFSSFGTFTFSTFDWSAQIPTVSDCTTRYIGGIIDDNDAWSERYEGNNSTVFTNGVPYTGSSFTPTPLNILLAEDAGEPNDTLGSATFITLPFVGSNLSIDTDLENDYYSFNLAASGVVDVGVFFSHGNGDIDLQLLSSGGTVLASSASVTNNESVSLHLSAGSYRIRVYGFGAGSCNRYTLDVDFTPDRPDLSVTALAAPSAAIAGDAIEVFQQVRNVGDLAAGSFRVGIYLSTNSICSTLDTFVASRSVAGLAIGASSGATTVVTIPPATLPAPYFLCVLVDDQFAITEVDEGNNSLFQSISIVDPATAIFLDGFESGDVSAWSSSP